ncbi:hypothetical protein RRG08_061799 [Elysia crispata]|uniref:Uncharacterized protein n=1 Tax=Elysia crispata TaxID=231223 RepID=A0AAE1DVB3_9GAST|nr:hypothetical protein RRG08_061799 [Elysia crispata]
MAYVTLAEKSFLRSTLHPAQKQEANLPSKSPFFLKFRAEFEHIVTLEIRLGRSERHNLSVYSFKPILESVCKNLVLLRLALRYCIDLPAWSSPGNVLDDLQGRGPVPARFWMTYRGEVLSRQGERSGPGKVLDDLQGSRPVPTRCWMTYRERSCPGNVLDDLQGRGPVPARCWMTYRGEVLSPQGAG